MMKRVNRDALKTLVVLQFAVYSFVAMFGFVSWALAFTNNSLILQKIIGEYLHGHILRWTKQLPTWGVLALLSAILASFATYLLWCSRVEGAYIGVISFFIGFVTNILFAQNILVRTLIGALIGLDTFSAPCNCMEKPKKWN